MDIPMPPKIPTCPTCGPKCGLVFSFALGTHCPKCKTPHSSFDMSETEQPEPGSKNQMQFNLKSLASLMHSVSPTENTIPSVQLGSDAITLMWEWRQDDVIRQYRKTIPHIDIEENSLKPAAFIAIQIGVCGGYMTEIVKEGV